MITYLMENIIKKDLHTQWFNEEIPCHGFKYLSILTDGAFNPEPISGTDNRLNHYFILKDSNRLFPIYGEMRNIPLGKDTEIRYWNRRADFAGFNELENGFGNIIFYLSSYPNDFISQKENSGFQWEDSFILEADVETFYHFGINKVDGTHILAMPFIPDCFNKIIYLLNENFVSQKKNINLIFEDGDVQAVALVPISIIELPLPCKRFYLEFQANESEQTRFDFMMKFLKA